MKLTILRGDQRVRQVDLAGRDLRIGRGPDNDLVLEDPDKGVSRLHAELRYQNGQYVVIDLNSQNGTWVEGKRVPRAVVAPNVPIVIGPYRLLLESEAEIRADGIRVEAQPVAAGPGGSASDTLRAEAIPAGRPSGAGLPPQGPSSKATRLKRGRSKGARAQVQRSGDPVAWLARQPKPVIFGGFVVIVILIMVLGQLFGPSSQQSAPARLSSGAPKAADATPAIPRSSADNKKIIADHLVVAKALIDRGDLQAAITEHLDAILVIEPEHAEALDLKARAQVALFEQQPPRPAVPAAPIVATPQPSQGPEPSAPAQADKPQGGRPPTPQPAERYAPTVARRAGESVTAWHARDRRMKDLYDRARLTLARSEYEAAVRSLEMLLAEQPNYRDGADLLTRATAGVAQARADAAERAIDAGAKWEKAGDLVAALQEYERARKVNPQQARIDQMIARLKDQMKTSGEDAFKRARQYDAAGRLPEAIALYERALKLLPADHPSRLPARERLELLKLNRGSAPDPGSVACGDPRIRAVAASFSPLWARLYAPRRSLAGALCAPPLCASRTQRVQNSRCEPHNGPKLP